MSGLLTAPAERLAALEAAARVPGGEQHILAALEDPAPSVRERAIRLAARYVEPAVLGELVADGENAVRRNAGLGALERQGPYAVPHLVAMLDRGDPELMLFALQQDAERGHRLAHSQLACRLDGGLGVVGIGVVQQREDRGAARREADP